jgi:N-methylhydantoinase A/oxoprolinase/acetone carboxylase beta subunit
VQTILAAEEDLDPKVLSDLIGEADQVGWDIRYRGQSFELTVTDGSADPARLRELFEAAHEERYGYRDPSAPIELVTVRRQFIEAGPGFTPGPPPEEDLEGPATIDLGEATVFVPEGWKAAGTNGGLIRIFREL